MASKADIEKPISLVRPANAKMVQAILTRAHKQERSADKALARMANQALRPVRSKGLLSKALGQAMAHHGRTKKGAASLRPKAPDTNGRAFHFSHSTVGRGSSGAGRGGASGGSGGAGPAATGSSGTTQESGSSTARAGSPGFPDLGSREAGHQRYVERDAALARDAVEVFGIPVGKSQAREEGREQQEGWERDPAAERGQNQEKKAKPIEVDIEALQKEIEQASRGQRTQSARAAQEYIEDPSKVAQQTRHGHSNSFGTIGETFEERVSFWNDVIKHEREKDARTQIRLVLELPHEASPAVRQEIIKKFCQQYEDLGVPYWASIHAPTKKNDHRNHHAHVVHGIRPTKRMIDPSTGKMAWDFTIVETYKKKNRVKKQRHPFRQNAVEAFWDRDYVRDTRKKFAEVTNEVLAAHGYDIRYDARSYKDMGIDIEPMKHVSRVIADKAKVRDFVVLDAAWTRRLIDQEMNAAAVERDKTYTELKAVEKRISGLTNDIRKLKEVNPKLPAKMKLSPMSRLTVTAAKQLSQRMLEIEYAKISQRFADEATARTIQHIIDSTAPVSAHRDGRARKIRPMPDGPEAPNPEALKVLHESAKEEMRLHRIATAGRARKLGYMAMGVLHQWQEQAQPKNPPPPTQAPGKAKRATARATAPTMAPPPPTQPPQAARATARHPTPTMEPPRAQPTPQQRQSPAFAPDYGAAEAAARQGPAKVARPIYHTPPRNMLEVIERTSMTGQRFTKKMHDFVDAQTAGIAASVAIATEAGPAALAELWEAMKRKVDISQRRPAEPAPAPPIQEPQATREEPPPVIYVQPQPAPTPPPYQPAQPARPALGGAAETVAPTVRAASPGTVPARADGARTSDTTPAATPVETKPIRHQPAASETTSRPTERQVPAARRDSTKDDGKRGTPDAVGVGPEPAPTTACSQPANEPVQAQRAAPQKPAQKAAPARQEASKPDVRTTQPPVDGLDLGDPAGSREADGAQEAATPKRVLSASDFKRDRKVLRKEGNRPITQEELAYIPPKAIDPDAKRKPLTAEAPERRAEEPEQASTPEAEVKARRKKVRRKVLIIGRSGNER